MCASNVARFEIGWSMLRILDGYASKCSYGTVFGLTFCNENILFPTLHTNTGSTSKMKVRLAISVALKCQNLTCLLTTVPLWRPCNCFRRFAWWNWGMFCSLSLEEPQKLPSSRRLKRRLLLVICSHVIKIYVFSRTEQRSVISISNTSANFTTTMRKCAIFTHSKVGLD